MAIRNPALPAAITNELQAPPTNLVATKAADALKASPILDGTNLEVEVADSLATVHGSAISHYQIREIERVLGALSELGAQT